MAQSYGPNNSMMAFSRPGTNDPAYLRKQALSAALMKDATSHRPAYSWGEALARALEGGVVGIGSALEDKSAQARDRKFQEDFGAATKTADPQKLADALAGSGNADVQAMVPWQRMQDASSAREAALRGEDRAWRTAESDKDREIRERHHAEQVRLQQQAQARASAGSWSEPRQVMLNGKPVMVQFNSRGGHRVVDGMELPQEPQKPANPIFQEQPLDGNRVQKVVSYDGGRTFEPFGAAYDRREPFIIQEQIGPDGQMERVAIPREQVAQAMANRQQPPAAPPPQGGQPSPQQPGITVQGVQTMPPQGATPAPNASGGVSLGPSGKPSFNEAQGKAAGFADRMTSSHKSITDLEAQGTDALAAVASKVPVVGNYMLSADRQMFEQAQRDFINSVLRRESGAVISVEEFDNARKQYFPQPGDSPEVIAQKRRNREITLDAMRRDAGPAYRPGVNSGAGGPPPPPDGFYPAGSRR